MAGESYGALIPVTGSTFTPGQAARASQIERIRQNLAILGKPRYWHLGSASLVGHVDTAYVWAEDAPVVELCEEDVRGLTCTLRVWVKVGDAAGTVRVRLRNTTDGITLAELPAGIAVTAWTLYTAAVTPPTGTVRKPCRIEIVAGDASIPAYYRGAQLEVKL
jgi:hypothetical protein